MGKLDFVENSLEKYVVQNGLCIGCGVCSLVNNSPMKIKLDQSGCFIAEANEKNIDANLNDSLMAVCPFSGASKNEDELSSEVFIDHRIKKSDKIGSYISTYAGFVKEGSFRQNGSSGGMGKWILYELIDKNLVDYVIQVYPKSPSNGDDLVYSYQISDHSNNLGDGSKSVYYPIELTEVLTFVKENSGRYVVTGVPCFIKAIRLLMREEEVFSERIKYCVGLVCGHLKSTKYAEMIGWQFGVDPGNLSYIDFRKKLPGAKANQKGLEVKSIDQQQEVRTPDIVQNVFGTNYNYGFFQYKACDYCDDVVGETADISVGDAWLPEYLNDGEGTNIIIVRHPDVQNLIDQAIREDRLSFDSLPEEKITASQKGGFRQRREGLAYRLYLSDRENNWRPQKRVKPMKYHINKKRREIYKLRSKLSEYSHILYAEAVKREDFSYFEQGMSEYLDQYKELYKPSLWTRIRKGLQRRYKRYFVR